MISNQVIFNLGRSLDRFMNLQTMMSSGRRINQPSDDPIGTQKDLNYRKVLTEINQFKKNISNGLNVLSTYDNMMGDAGDMISSAYQVAVSLSNDTYDATSRDGAANEIESLFNQIVDIANAQVDGRYILSGFRTKTKPFEKSANGVNYRGDAGKLQLEMESGSKVDVNLIGADVLFKPLSTLGENGNLKVGVESGTLLSDLHLGDGIDQTPGIIVVSDNNLGISVNVDISTAVTLGNVTTLVNNQLAAGGITNITLEMGADGSNLAWKTVDSGQISAGTVLSNLNNGNGVDLLNGKILIHNVDDSINVEVDLSGAADVGDAIVAINNALTAAGVNNVSASINAAGTGLSITDTNGTSLGLAVDEASSVGSTAADLGLLGFINPQLNGAALNPRLDFSVSEAAAGESTATDLGLVGNFHGDNAGGSLEPRILATTQLSLLNNGTGFDLGQIQICKGNALAYLDLSNSTYQTVGDIINAINSCGLDITAAINSAGTGIQITPNDNNSTFLVKEVGDGRTAHNLGIFGSSDILGSMLILIDALRSNDGEVAGQLIGNLQSGLQSVLNTRAAVGAKVIRLETTDSRLTSLSYNFTKLLSETEDADLTKLVSDLSTQENSYKAALIASSKIIQPSLLDFLK